MIFTSSASILLSFSNICFLSNIISADAGFSLGSKVFITWTRQNKSITSQFGFLRALHLISSKEECKNRLSTGQTVQLRAKGTKEFLLHLMLSLNPVCSLRLN